MSKLIDNTSCHCLKMRRSAENTILFYDSMLKPAGITARQYSLLYQIRRNPGCSVRGLSDAVLLDRSTLARSLKPLFNAELIEDVSDKRARDNSLYLTEYGNEVCAQAEKLWEKAQQVFEDKVGSENVKLLEEILLALQTL